MNYRSEIDGLRAIAVMSVVFFHANFNAFKGGYIGVDIFFVISGYLISSFLLRSRTTGTLSLKHFYLRRAKRILPALFIILLCCLPIAWLLLLPEQFIHFSQSLIAVVLFSSNVFFWKTSGYFDTASEFKPLIHTWSLGVEEQFYLLFPLVIQASKHLKLNVLFWICTVLFIGSLCLSHYESTRHTMANFFLLPTRIWELLAGALLTFFETGAVSGKSRDEELTIGKPYHSVLALMGLGFIIGSVLFFSEATPNPGFLTIIPVIGTLLIIKYSKNTWVHRVLSFPLLVRLGLISYSVYLWHQPLFAFTRIYYQSSLSTYVCWLLIFLTLALGYFTWRYIELPCRKDHNAFKPQLNYSILSAFISLFIGVGVAGIMTHGFEQRFKVPQKVVKSFELPERTKECFDRDHAHSKKNWLCKVNRHDPEHNTPDFFLTGDSHSLQLLSAFEHASQVTAKKGEFAGFSGCAPFLGVYPLIRDDQANKNCALLNERILDYVRDKHIKNIILVARWTYYTDGGYTSDPKLINYIGKNPSDSVDIKTSRAAFEYGLEKTIQIYKSSGVHVYILSQAPAQRVEPQTVYYDAFSQTIRVQKFLDEASVPLIDHIKLQSFVTSQFNKYKNDPDVTFIDMNTELCNKKFCVIGNRHGSYYQDNNHLSKSGALKVQQKLIDTLKIIT